MTPTSEGVDAGVFGARNTPTALYARFIPTFSNNLAPKGGQFLDGRAATLEIQAEKPFENPLEMNNTKQGVIDAVKLADYADDFRAVFGAAALDNIDAAFTDVTKAIAAFERTAIFAPLSSQFDVLGASGLTASAQNGLALFNGKADCARCHKSNTSPEVFADFGFHNIGVPGNPANPAVMDDPAFVDKGLGAVLNNSTHDGKLRTPTLRNVALTAPYMHNGVFNTLDEVMAFYNDSTRPTAEVAANVDADIGDLGLTTGEITDIINFLHALTDN
jgi:cytochrome c peroxidase